MKKAVLVALGALALASPAFADQNYTDGTGEDAASADITTIAVANSPAAKTLTLKVQIGNMPTLEDNAAVVVFFDADRNASTGDSGIDYLFYSDKTGYELDKWDGTQFTAVSGFSAQVAYNAGLLTAVFDPAGMGSPKAFDFGVLTLRGPDPENPALDGAPDGNALYTYILVTPPPPVAKATVKGSTVTVTPAPKAGKRVKVGPFSVTLSDGTSVSTTGVKCTATVGGAKLKGTGAGGCTFTLPKQAKGKKLVVHVSGRYGAAALSKTVSYTVK
jgi:hypothetical protein